MVNGELDAAFLGDCDHAVQLLGGHGNRLFTDDILAGLGGLYHQIIMLVVVGCNQHNVNFRVVHQLIVGRIALDALLHVFQLLLVNVRDTNHADSVHLSQHFFMLVAHKAVAYDTDSDIIHKKHLFPSNYVVSQIFCAQQHRLLDIFHRALERLVLDLDAGVALITDVGKSRYILAPVDVTQTGQLG